MTILVPALLFMSYMVREVVYKRNGVKQTNGRLGESNDLSPLSTADRHIVS